MMPQLLLIITGVLNKFRIIQEVTYLIVIKAIEAQLSDWPKLTADDQIKANENKVERVFGRGRLRVPYSIIRDDSTSVWTVR